ncbi:MAG: type II toxin-antitoxin system VapC family toxin [Rhodospirillales bacterium]|nr:type II toxin-antitoxin system VapC family toxin [Rhodospirillales bacterium]
MRLLLDSHAVYWWMTGNSRLSASAKELILDSANAVLVSAASIYEIEYKAKRKRVDLPPQELRAALRRNAVEELAITHDHAEYAAHLRWARRDPWDRLLAAQAFLERCIFVSVDQVFDATSIDRRW